MPRLPVLPVLAASAVLLSHTACGRADSAGASASSIRSSAGSEATAPSQPPTQSKPRPSKPSTKPTTAPTPILATPVAAEPVGVGRPPRGASTVNGAIDGWLAACERGDMAKAWSLLSVESRRAVGGYARFASFRTDLAEGWGAWASANEEPRSAAVVDHTPAGPVRVVTLFGLVRQEGPERLRATALVVRRTTTGRHVVSTFERAGYVRLTRPERDGQVVPADASLLATTRSQSTVLFVLDGRVHRSLGEASEQDAVIDHTYRPDDGLTRGVHLVTAVTLGPRGAIQASAVTFRVR